MMRILSISIVLFCLVILQGCILTPLSLLAPAVGFGTGAAVVGAHNATNRGVKTVNEEELAKKLKPGMTKEEVNAVLQRKPNQVIPNEKGDMAMYLINTSEISYLPGFGKNKFENKTVTVIFNVKGEYVRHTFSETKMCGSQFSGMSQEKCEEEKQGQQSVAN